MKPVIKRKNVLHLSEIVLIKREKFKMILWDTLLYLIEKRINNYSIY
jgi:hypothetical protein